MWKPERSFWIQWNGFDKNIEQMNGNPHLSSFDYDILNNSCRLGIEIMFIRRHVADELSNREPIEAVPVNILFICKEKLNNL